MIVAVFNVYLVLLFVLVKLGIIRFTLFWKISPAIVLVLLLFGLFIPMGWGAPQGSTMVVRNSVAIVPPSLTLAMPEDDTQYSLPLPPLLDLQ